MAPIAVSNFEELRLADRKPDRNLEREVEDITGPDVDDDEDDEAGECPDDTAAGGM